MEIIEGSSAKEFLSNIIHEDTQVNEKSIDLTASEVYRIKNQGEIDFGGGERKDSEISKIEPVFRSKDDDYGWWELEPGRYLIKHNEDLKDSKNAIVQPHPRLIRNSADHPTIITDELDLMPLQVNGHGIAIKENSRVSKLVILSD